ncbi:lactonase family protein [Paenibacillus xerothermodurans]|uniref:Lactonase family protein n=1 Tax=Paenibacillus xerothermodurans TaxID=1977292 RepID=A0A2W1P264_PAEXE|nr:lactonase family protein [Paenibacillus xerothermodurans]PZE21238.1 lactonase family protein [Paenibacillus xerothermodurans]
MGNSQYNVYFGSYADKQSPGIYVYRFDEDSEELVFTEFVSGLKQPSFIKISEKHRMLYSFSQGDAEQEKAAAVAYRIEPGTGKLAYAGQQPAADKSATHINTDVDDRYLLLVSYAGGSVSILPIGEDGMIQGLTDEAHHEGSSINTERQQSAHPHSVYPDPTNRFVVVPDLGMDKLMVYRLDREHGKLQLHDDVKLAPGSGPRHLAFHPNRDFAYVIQELSSSITAMSYDPQAGKLEPTQMVNTLPEQYDGPANICAEIQISPCGKYLYGSNRGHDSIVVFAIDTDTGMLTEVEHVSTLGAHPRHFSLTPSGRYLFAANKDSDEVQLFRVDRNTGRLTSTGQAVAIAQPTCVRFSTV